MRRKHTSKQQRVTNTITGAVTASLKTRQHAVGGHIAEGTPIKLSRKEWQTVLTRTRQAIARKNLPTLAAGIAYYSTLAFFPFLAAAVAIAALLISSEQLDGLIAVAKTYLPGDISGVVASQLQNLVARRADNSLTAIVAIAIALFGASGASKSLVTASNVTYDVRESRGWLTQQLWAVLWTAGGIVFGTSIVALLAVNQALLGHLGVPDMLAAALLYGRWLVLLVFSICGLAVFYTYGPNRPRVRWQWVSWGAIIATLAWLVTTALFFVYVQNFANYTQSYSLFTGIIVLMIWMNLSALIVLIGAEVNHQLEVVGSKKWGNLLPRIR